MLAIRMQRVGRKGHPQYRMIVQEAHRQPTSGRVVALLGHYDPHTKQAVIDVKKADFYLSHGAQPSERAVRVLESEKVKLPSWVQKTVTDRQKTIKHPEKLRRNQSEVSTEDAAEAIEQGDGSAQSDEAKTTQQDAAGSEPATEAPVAAETTVKEEKNSPDSEEANESKPVAETTSSEPAPKDTESKK